MADLTAANVTVTVNEQQIVSKKRRNRVTITFGNGTLTYPSGGVPMPSFSAFGMVRNLDFLTVFDEDDASGIMWKYDRTNNKLRAYFPTGGATASPASGTAVPQVTSGASTASAVNATTPALTPGVAKELASASTAPAAHTFQAEAVGW
jgi:hypothetical protein